MNFELLYNIGKTFKPILENGSNNNLQWDTITLIPLILLEYFKWLKLFTPFSAQLQVQLQ